MTRARALLYPICLLVLCCVAGCAALGVVANAMPQLVAPKYPGLKGQTVGVMVWADRGLRIDYPTIQLDVASAVQSRLLQKQTDPSFKPGREDLEGTTFPYEPRSFVRFQLDHPEIDALPVTEFAGRLGITRLIYIELEQFATRSQMAIDLYRGSVTATLQVVEIDESGKARIAYQENGIRAVFPPKSKPEGIPVGRDDIIYNGTIRELAIQIVNRLVTYDEGQ